MRIYTKDLDKSVSTKLGFFTGSNVPGTARRIGVKSLFFLYRDEVIQNCVSTWKSVARRPQ